MAAGPEKVPLLIIEGNIGVGKSTLLRKLRDEDPLAGTEHCYIEEEIDPDLLQKFYAGELEKHVFQMKVLTSRFKKLVEAYTKGYKKIVIDRYIYGDLAFAMANIRTPKEYAMYFSLWEKCLEHLERCFDVTCIFMQGLSADVLLGNIKSRGRESETSITAEYLEDIEIRTYQCVMTFCTGRIICAAPKYAPPKYHEDRLSPNVHGDRLSPIYMKEFLFTADGVAEY